MKYVTIIPTCEDNHELKKIVQATLKYLKKKIKKEVKITYKWDNEI